MVPVMLEAAGEPEQQSQPESHIRGPGGAFVEERGEDSGRESGDRSKEHVDHDTGNSEDSHKTRVRRIRGERTCQEDRPAAKEGEPCAPLYPRMKVGDDRLRRGQAVN